jgi:hypothetical protein
MKGFSARNLLFMRGFAEAYPDDEEVKQLVSDALERCVNFADAERMSSLSNVSASPFTEAGSMRRLAFVAPAMRPRSSI